MPLGGQGGREHRHLSAPTTPRRPSAPLCRLQYPCSRPPQPHRRLPWQRDRTACPPLHQWREHRLLPVVPAAPPPQQAPCPARRRPKRPPPSISGDKSAPGTPRVWLISRTRFPPCFHSRSSLVPTASLLRNLSCPLLILRFSCFPCILSRLVVPSARSVSAHGSSRRSLLFSMVVVRPRPALLPPPLNAALFLPFALLFSFWRPFLSVLHFSGTSQPTSFSSLPQSLLSVAVVVAPAVAGASAPGPHAGPSPLLLLYRYTTTTIPLAALPR